MKSLIEEFKIVPILSDLDLTTGASMPGASINMSDSHHAVFICGLQTLGTASAHVKVFSGATSAALTTALTFRYAFGGAAAGSANCDVLAAWATSADLTLTHTTYDNYMLVIEVDAQQMAANGHKYLTIEFSDPDTGAAGNVQVHALLSMRHSNNRSVTVLS
jgi:hypothetical protein